MIVLSLVILVSEPYVDYYDVFSVIEDRQHCTRQPVTNAEPSVACWWLEGLHCPYLITRDLLHACLPFSLKTLTWQLTLKVRMYSTIAKF